jgi:hypothetical protein
MIILTSFDCYYLYPKIIDSWSITICYKLDFKEKNYYVYNTSKKQSDSSKIFHPNPIQTPPVAPQPNPRLSWPTPYYLWPEFPNYFGSNGSS